ncbi:MAG TPA: MFS transporter [Chthoniobacter sp.]|jgi:MFS family permease
MPAPTRPSIPTDADRNWRRFVLFRVLFNARFYYPVLAILFLDLGLSATEYTILNFAWALANLFTDLPAGVLADRIGRKPLVVAAAICMVAEMTLLGLAPRNGGLLLFLCCLANRLLSGTAEGMASGADEALVFDSLAERGRAGEWPRVLDQVMRWQGVGIIIAMIVGGAVYDPAFLQRLLGFIGVTAHLDKAVTLRFPIYLNFVTALLTLACALGLREPQTRTMQVVPGDAPEAKIGDAASGCEKTAWQIASRAGRWIIQTPAALFVITAAVLIDSVTRLFLTFSSSYFRLISLPEALFGLIGAGMGGLGLLVSPIARRMVTTNTMLRNYVLLAATVSVGLVGVAFRWTHWGIIFLLPLAGSMTALGYIVSYYLNALTDSTHRATVLSFKGVAINLGYGFISLLFALALRTARPGAAPDPDAALAQGLTYLPYWILIGAVLCLLCFAKHRRLLTLIPKTEPADL